MTRISLHGGHSGQFCDHARDTLAEIVAAYHSAGFTLVGLTEHMPPWDDAWLYPDEVELARTAVWMQDRFECFIVEARRLEREYTGRMRIAVGMEAEWYPGCAEWVQRLRQRHALDYVVGSVHHLQGMCFDCSPAAYAAVMDRCGGLDGMYVQYFDVQLEMLQALKPEVVGHFDLIRLHDPGYLQTLASPDVWPRIMRNLEWVRKVGAVLDINARALLKGQSEPYVCALIRDAAATMDIMAAYGDDAHGVDDVGYCFGQVEEMLARQGLHGPAVSFGAGPATGPELFPGPATRAGWRRPDHCRR